MYRLLRLLPALILMCLAVAALTSTHQASAGGKGIKVLPGDSGLVRQIRHYRQQTWRWQNVMGVSRTRANRSTLRHPSRTYKRWVRDLWKRRAIRAHRRASNPPHKSGWLCIHRHEGQWNDPNAPYYGGLQMDISFQRTYGARLLRTKGTADHWTPLEQMWVAEKAHRSGRGYYPWPNTARYCGLI
ncbi:MAG TPA: hypothetical protein VFT86_01835 [Gaiellaceae bacterium]|nr:hypothetical protein [Gaiellaceae bacterium]